MVQIIYKSFKGSSKLLDVDEKTDPLVLVKLIALKEQVPWESLRIYLNGKPLESLKPPIESNFIPISLHHVIPGGKGGFGSMLRAIGAQIEKTTNKEACRDLSGRRLRDIKAEIRFKHWMAHRAEAQDEKEKKRKEKLEKFREEIKIMFEDPEYFKSKEDIPQTVDEALELGLKKIQNEPSTSGTSNKRKEHPEAEISSKKSKSSLWLGLDLSDEDDDEDEDADEEPNKKENSEAKIDSSGGKGEVTSATSPSDGKLKEENESQNEGNSSWTTVSSTSSSSSSSSSSSTSSSSSSSSSPSSSKNKSSAYSWDTSESTSSSDSSRSEGAPIQLPADLPAP